ncbi:hypothetical protein ACFY2K_42100 [Kitasatospora sp. NPDC001309]|uniref:hypothetical protein n=1 Tax=Kitasatospora sp. NPDC001309 TaxID=3364013 RepID=UPI0036B584AE
MTPDGAPGTSGASGPPLVLPDECERLRTRLAAVARGEGFLLLGSDPGGLPAGTRTAGTLPPDTQAAGSVDASAQQLGHRLAALSQMAVLLTYALSVPVVRIGPAPERGCEAAAANLARAFIANTGVHQLHARNREFAARSPAGAHHRELTRRIDSTLAFMRACGIDPAGSRSTR